MHEAYASTIRAVPNRVSIFSSCKKKCYKAVPEYKEATETLHKKNVSIEQRSNSDYKQFTLAKIHRLEKVLNGKSKGTHKSFVDAASLDDPSAGNPITQALIAMGIAHHDEELLLIKTINDDAARLILGRDRRPSYTP